MLYYKLTEADTVYYIELIQTDPREDVYGKYYFQCQFDKQSDLAILPSARLVVESHDNDLMAFLRNGFALVNTLSNLEMKATLSQCYQVIDIIRRYPQPLPNPRDN
jgi:hypothetical protein